MNKFSYLCMFLEIEDKKAGRLKDKKALMNIHQTKTQKDYVTEPISPQDRIFL